MGKLLGSNYCFIGNLGTMWGNTHLTGCNGEIIGFYRSLTNKETSYIHQYLIKKNGLSFLLMVGTRQSDPFNDPTLSKLLE